VPIHARTPDFLYHHITLEHRVTNLETGVHPTTADVDYFDSNVWTLMDIHKTGAAPTWDYQRDGLVDKLPYWRKRVGIISLRGGIMAPGGTSGTWPTFPSTGLTFLDSPLPKAARPGADMMFTVGITIAPWYINLKVQADGTCLLFPGGWNGSGTGVACYFDGVMWVPSDG
jgi:hypothetical protein